MNLNKGCDYRVRYEPCDDGGTFYVHDIHCGMHFEYPLIWTRMLDGKHVFYQGKFDEPLFTATPSETNDADVMGRKLRDSYADFIML